MKPNMVIDASGLACPLPLLKVKLGLNEVAQGEVVQLLATDPASEKDVHTFVHLTAHTMLAFEQVESVYSYTIKKG